MWTNSYGQTGTERQHEASKDARKVLSDQRYQTEVPENETGHSQSNSSQQQKKPPEKPEPRPEPASQENSPAAGIFSTFTTLLEGLMLLLVFGFAGVLIVIAFRIAMQYVQSGTETAKTHSEETFQPASDEEMRETLEDADKLAEKGLYTDAVRKMFRDVLQFLETDQDIPTPKSTTNREYLRKIPENAEFRTMLQHLIEAEEQFYYANQKCSKGDYEQCRQYWKRIIGQH